MTNVQYDLKFEITYFNKHYGIPSLAKQYIFNVRYFSGKLKIKLGFLRRPQNLKKNLCHTFDKSCAVRATLYLPKS